MNSEFLQALNVGLQAEGEFTWTKNINSDLFLAQMRLHADR